MISPKTILITGASSGIGEATAKHLASLGHHVVLGARRLDRIEATAQAINSAGGTAVAVALDVTDRMAFHAFVEVARERFGRIDVLVNNAGVMPLSLFADLRVDEWDQMFDVNVRGVLNGIAAVLPVMTGQGSGHIVNIGSVAAYRVDPTAGVYCATKFAVRAISDGLRQESSTLRVTMVSPGLTATELLDGIQAPAPRELLKGMAKQLAIEPGAIAEAIAFAIAQPPHVDINEIVVRPTAQG